MSRRSKKKFEYGQGVYYFSIKKGYNNEITIKRMDKEKALLAYASYKKTYKDACEWLGKWEGKKFVESNYEEEKKLVGA